MNIRDKLATMQPQDFLNIENLRSDMDALAGAQYAQTQYAKGLDIGHRSTVVHISIRNVWSADYKDGGKTISSEMIGYHAHSAELLRGFVDSGVTIVVWREIPDPYDDLAYRVTDTVIQGER